MPAQIPTALRAQGYSSLDLVHAGLSLYFLVLSDLHAAAALQGDPGGMPPPRCWGLRHCAQGSTAHAPHSTPGWELCPLRDCINITRLRARAPGGSGRHGVHLGEPGMTMSTGTRRQRVLQDQRSFIKQGMRRVGLYDVRKCRRFV